MEDPALVSPSRIERLLELACAYNSPTSIHAESGDDVYRYKSRLLDMRKTPESKTLVIDQPVTDGPAIALRPNIEITLFFAIDQGRYAFDSVVLRKTDYELGNRRKVSALEIAYPNVMKSGQRRAYFRVPVPVRTPITVDCFVIEETAKPKEEEERAGASRARLKARTIDISAGGMLLAFEEGDTHLADVGAKLALRFSLASDETPLKINGVIRRIERKSATEQLRAAIEFVDIDEEFEYKLAINRLYRYVAERQRNILQSGSK